jgi:putative spermidine/putrescine transport system permease protein
MVVYAFAFLAPLVWIVGYSFFAYSPLTLIGTTPTVANYVRVLTDSYYVEGMVNSLVVSLAATLLSIVTGFPVAYHLTRLGSRGKAIATFIILTPTMVSMVITSYAWEIFFDTNGALNFLLITLGAIHQPLTLLRTEGAVIFGLWYSFCPFTILALNASLEGIDRSQINAAKILGADPIHAFLNVIFPLSLPGLVAGSVLTFTLAMSSFIVPYVLAGRVLKLIAVQIYDFTTVELNFPVAFALSMVLLIIVTAAIVICTSLIERRSLKWLR